MSEILVESVYSKRRWLEKEAIVAKLIAKGWVRIVEVEKPKSKSKKPQGVILKEDPDIDSLN